MQQTRAKQEVAVGLALLFLLALGLSQFRACTGQADSPSGSTQMKASTSLKQSHQAIRQQIKRKRQTSDTAVQVRRYHPETGRLVEETLRTTRRVVEQDRVSTQSVAHTVLASATQDVTHAAEAPPTGLTAGVLALPSSAGLTAGVTLLELKPLSVSAQLGVLAVPQPGLAAGMSLNGEVAPRLVAGIGLYAGPGTLLGYTPVPGLPVALQPGLSLQYRF